MVRLNKNALTDAQTEKIFTQLSKTFAKAGESQAERLLVGLLGHEERMMIAKRLSAVIMLQQGYRPYTISQILKMSPSTVGRIKSQLEADKYGPVLQIIKKDKATYEAIINTIDSILTVGGILPHYGQQTKNFKI